MLFLAANIPGERRRRGGSAPLLPTLGPFEGAQGVHLHAKVFQSGPPPKFWQVDDEGASHHLGSQSFDQLDPGFGRPTGCEEVVDQENLDRKSVV